MNRTHCTLFFLLALTACTAPKYGPGVSRYSDGTKIETVNGSFNPSALTVSEFDTLRMQLSRCWALTTGGYIPNGQADIQLTVNRNRKIISIKPIIDKEKLNNMDYLLTIQTAEKGLRSKECQTLNLPSKKYNAWKEMTVTFDAREML
jgi:hypothetical protein